MCVWELLPKNSNLKEIKTTACVCERFVKKKEKLIFSLSPRPIYLTGRIWCLNLVYPAACTITRILRTAHARILSGRDLIVILRRRANEHPFVHQANPDKWVQINADERRRGVKAK